jgi:hypothetical protein
LVLDKAVDNALGALKGLAGVNQVEQQPAANGHVSYRVIGKENADLCPAIYNLANQHQWPLRELRNDRQTLESVFSKLAAG